MAQPAASPEEAGITPVTDDMSPWRAYGLGVMNYDQVWIIALNNGNIAAFKRGHDTQAPGTIGGTEFLLFAPDGSLVTPQPVPGTYNADGTPYPLVDYTQGLTWGAFTLGASPDRANGTGFVVHNEGQLAASAGTEHGDEVGDEAFTMVQLFDNDGNPIGTNINAFGTLTAEPGEYRDIGASILSNGDIVSIGENRQSFDELLDSVEANVGEVVIAVILSPDGSTKVPPFVVHTGEDGLYLGGSTSAVYQNLVAFDGGFMIDYNAGMRWYNNDGTPRSPVQPDHAELDGELLSDDLAFFLSTNSGGRGDGMALASDGKNTVVKSTTISDGVDTVGVLIYYNADDGTVKNTVRFDDVDLAVEMAAVDRTHCDMDVNGNVFVVWQDGRFGGSEEGGGYNQIFGRFFDKDGVPFGPSFPVYQNWKEEPVAMDYGGSIGEVPMGDNQQPRCAINDQVAAVVCATNIVPDFPDTLKEMSSAFGLIIDEAVVRIFKNPLAVDVADWAIY